MRSAILAARRKSGTQHGAAGSEGASLPPFVHKTSLPRSSDAAASSSVSAAAGKPAAPASADPPVVLPMPRWNGDISKKAWKRDEINARNREETQRKRARREGKEYTPSSSNRSNSGSDGEAELGESLSRRAKADEKPMLSAAKLQFLQQHKELHISSQQSSAATSQPSQTAASHAGTSMELDFDDFDDSEPAALVAARNNSQAAAAASTAKPVSSSSTAPSSHAGAAAPHGLPAFRSTAVSGGGAAAGSGANKFAPLHRGSGVSPVKKAANNQERDGQLCGFQLSIAWSLSVACRVLTLPVCCLLCVCVCVCKVPRSVTIPSVSVPVRRRSIKITTTVFSSCVDVVAC